MWTTGIAHFILDYWIEYFLIIIHYVATNIMVFGDLAENYRIAEKFCGGKVWQIDSLATFD